MSGPTAAGGNKDGLVKDPLPRSCRLILSYFPSSYLRARLRRVEDAGRTPTSRIRFRPSVLGRHPVLLRGVEASNWSRVRASSSDSALPQQYPGPLSGFVSWLCFLSFVLLGLARPVHTTRGVFMLQVVPQQFPLSGRPYSGLINWRSLSLGMLSSASGIPYVGGDSRFVNTPGLFRELIC